MEFWKANDEVGTTVQQLIGANHPDLALVSDEIAVVFREKAGKAGGQVILGNSKKVAALVNAIGGTDYKFVLELGADVWENDLTAKQREALLDHLLTACRCEEDPKTGATKYKVARPDIMAFRENVERYGMWFPKEEEDDEPSPVEAMFSSEPEEAAKVAAATTTAGIATTPDQVEDMLDDLLGDE